MKLDEATWVRLSARHEIENLITRYCMACDDRKLDELASLFTEDATIEMNGVPTIEGSVGLFKHFNTTLTKMGATYHWSHDRMINVDENDHNLATGIVQGHCEMAIDDQTWITALRYTDTYRRVADEWKFARRFIEFMYFLPIARLSEALSSSERVFRNGNWQRADVPDQQESYIAFRAAREPASA
ncbi:nuclear transport factor 2 family protein [Sphingobium sp. DEHP117]|uniref:nuclear transport factor 2 family protein n=1 Tax=Sphingobium sp. DEHP117 TaxID=2993436 RepID=UPI0027D52071|nr:nuclear transport factor 2 family protein [Sphingobium sp. DEHP117]MDQ4421574.1 nuclear transport factor 2 family protein [Sphingobium sp. DEHP117]